ncbi:tetratricopeptide repeat protein [Rhodobacter sp. Har01]|uniref:tetratricopeptide repeat protein n=1 Tax=Rhodobacter sp. Har01 TaxID=2883999 RepID=UPI001D06984F|nr:tetratricopeptide repeat protein [Rhodobacter sp. Har01]MCB6177850.1 tetratricopeptide repeat protein [Rhodobacter sp. Har01]
MPRLLLTAALTALSLGLSAPAVLAEAADDDGDPGAYLAARNAEANGDFRAAAAWYARAALADPSNLRILEGSMFANLSLGKVDLAAQVAARLQAGGVESAVAAMALVADEALREDYTALVAAGENGRSVGPLLDELALAWAKLGEGRMSDALADFDKVAATKGFEAFGYYHKALALAQAGDFEGADAILSGKVAGPINLNRRGILAHVQILSQLERNPEALALIDQAFGTEPEPYLDSIRARLKAGEPLAFDTARTARDGIAEVFFSVATVLNSESDPIYTLLHARIATILRPDHAEALLLTAAMLENTEQYDLAVETYATFAPDNPNYYSAEIGRADALHAAGKKDAAIEALQVLARSHGQIVLVQSALGDMLRREERWAEAIPAYDAAIALLPEVRTEHWPLFFSRAVCEDSLKNWDKAEADFRKALELNPNQPQVLNYLGYSFVDRGVNLDEALSMIERAVKAEPESGYIIDSLAWVYFRLGRYADALAPMEKASLLEPVDPIVTDHLGDVYWAVGRQREAEFQWRRALSFGPQEKDAIRIRRKLEVGLDAVLAEEGAKPLEEVEAAANGN